MLQKHLFLLKFSGGYTPILRKGPASRLLENASKAFIFVEIFRGLRPQPPTPSIDFQDKGQPQVDCHHHGFSFLANMPNTCIKTVKDCLSLMQLGVTKQLLRLGAKPPQA